MRGQSPAPLTISLSRVNSSSNSFIRSSLPMRDPPERLLRWNYLNQRGRTVPSPFLGKSLIDTGADGSCVDPTVVRHLSLEERGIAETLTPSTGQNVHLATEGVRSLDHYTRRARGRFFLGLGLSPGHRIRSVRKAGDPRTNRPGRSSALYLPLRRWRVFQSGLADRTAKHFFGDFVNRRFYLGSSLPTRVNRGCFIAKRTSDPLAQP